MANTRQTPLAVASNEALTTPQKPLAVAPNETQTAPLLQMLAKLLAPFIAAEIHGAANDNASPEWIDQTKSPLGRRAHCVAARAGKLTARKVGRRWLVRRSDLEVFIATHGQHARNESSINQEQNEGVQALLHQCGIEMIETPRPKRSRAR